IRIAAGPDGRPIAGMWWTNQSGIRSKAFFDVEAALEAAQVHRMQHDLEEVLIALDGVQWQAGWGELQGAGAEGEPMGDISRAGLTDDEYADLASGIEAQRDA
ncbi:MAG: hypothetical protein MO852_13580, partial [Candidatus Devosia euplotis]|nr:hypothetical protein [Candidatus Devosia euplotis]